MDALKQVRPILSRPVLFHVGFANSGVGVPACHLCRPQQIDGRDERVLSGEFLPSLLDADELGVEAMDGVRHAFVAPALGKNLFLDQTATEAAKHHVVAESNHFRVGVGFVNAFNNCPHFFHAVGHKLISTFSGGLAGRRAIRLLTRYEWDELREWETREGRGGGG